MACFFIYLSNVLTVPCIEVQVTHFHCFSLSLPRPLPKMCIRDRLYIVSLVLFQIALVYMKFSCCLKVGKHMLVRFAFNMQKVRQSLTLLLIKNYLLYLPIVFLMTLHFLRTLLTSVFLLGLYNRNALQGCEISLVAQGSAFFAVSAFTE